MELQVIGKDIIRKEVGVEGVVLAAGYSSRMGANKMLMKLDGRAVLARCLESMSPACSRIVVVGGHKIDEIVHIVETYPHACLILNEDYSEGMFSSVLAGIREVNDERFFLCPGDYPLITIDTYINMLSISGEIIVPTYGGRRGHPILLSSSLIPEIINGTHFSLREFINSRSLVFVEVPDPGIHVDIDTVEDYNSIRISKNKDISIKHYFKN